MYKTATKNWDGRTEQGCKIGRYNSDTMIIWGVCRAPYYEKSNRTKTFDKGNYELQRGVYRTAQSDTQR